MHFSSSFFHITLSTFGLINYVFGRELQAAWEGCILSCVCAVVRVDLVLPWLETR